MVHIWARPEFAILNACQNASGKPWPELQNSKKRDTTLERMKLLETEGCELALIWPDLAPSGTKDPIKLAKKLDKLLLILHAGECLLIPGDGGPDKICSFSKG